MKKRLSKILWYGEELPNPATSSDDLEGLHKGELFLHLKDDGVTLWSLSADGRVVEISGGGDGDLSQYLLKSIWDRVWEIKTDSQGNEYIFGKLPVVTQYGITMYADGGELNLPSIYAGIPFDNKTIWLNPETKKVEVIGGTGGGVADSVHWNNIEGKPSFSAVATSGKYADLSGLPDLNVYATTEYLTAELKKYVTLNTEQTIGAHKDFLNGLSIGGLGITKSQDDVVYIDANLVVRGGITMYATDAIDVPSIIDALPIASASAKGIAAFNPNDFSVVDGYVSFIGKGSVDESVLADYAKKTDLSKYLPLSGGQMTGGIGYTLEPDSYEVGLPAAGKIDFTDFLKMLSTHKSFLASGYNIGDGNWYNIISLRHRNGADDGVSYGMYLYSSMTNYSDGNLYWGRQINGSWHNRVILDSVNWSQYVTSADGGSYLPLSGGEINSTNGSYALTIKANHYQVMLLQSNQSEASINYANNVGDVWVLGANAGGAPSSFGLWYNPINKLKFCVQKNGCTHIYYTATSIAGNNGNYTEGIRLYGATKDNSWSEINFGCDPNMTYDSHPNQWTIGRNGDPIYMNELTIRTYGSDKFVFFRTGDFLVSGGITMYSDIRKKTKLQDVELSLKQIADAPLIEHYYNSDTNKTTHVGSIAQYWAGLNDWFCKLDNEGYYTMEVQNAALASAISIARELVKYESKTDRKIRLLKQRVKELEDKIEKLENN